MTKRTVFAGWPPLPPEGPGWPRCTKRARLTQEADWHGGTGPRLPKQDGHNWRDPSFRMMKAGLERLCDAQAWLCHYCERRMHFESTAATPTIDHATPKAEGGTRANGNAVAACAWCNTTKGMLSATEFREILRLHGWPAKANDTISQRDVAGRCRRLRAQAEADHRRRNGIVWDGTTNKERKRRRREAKAAAAEVSRETPAAQNDDR